MRGGYLLGQGAYGCVFKPSVPCSNELNRRPGVSKVLFGEDSFDDEYEANKRVRRIDPKGVFTNPITHSCNIDEDVLHKEYGFSKCIVKKQASPYYNLIFEHSGIDMNAFFETDYDISNRSLHTNVLELCKGVHKMVRMSVVHLDIKPANILKTENKLIFIDFGLSSILKDIYSDDKSYITTYTYDAYPPEFKLYWAFVKLVSRLPTYSNSVPNLKTLMISSFVIGKKCRWQDNYDRNTKKYENVGIYATKMQTQVDAFIDTMIDRIAKTYKRKGSFNVKDLKAIFDSFASKVDVFSLGSVLLKMYYYADLGGFTKSQQKDLIRIITRMVDMNVYTRYTTKELVKDYTQFVTTLGSSKRTVEGCLKDYKLADLKKIAKENNRAVSGKKEIVCKRIMDLLHT